MPIETLAELLTFPRKNELTNKVRIRPIWVPFAKNEYAVLPKDYPKAWLIDGQFIEVKNNGGYPVILKVLLEG